MAKRKRTITDLQISEKNTCTISNRVQFSLKTRVQFNAIRQQMKQKKARVQFYMYVIRHQMSLYQRWLGKRLFSDQRI
jgi:hypothetical protein